MASLEQPAVVEISVVAGDNDTIALNLATQDGPMDCSSGVKLQVRAGYAAANPTALLAYASGAGISGDVSGNITVGVDGGQTQTVGPGVYLYDLVVGGITVIPASPFVILGDVTR